MGYVALAIDMYGDGKIAAHPDDAKKFMSEMISNLDGAVQRFKAAQALLANDPRVDGGKIAAIGYCFGGAVVLHMARIGDDLDAVASFHGNLVAAGADAARKPSPGRCWSPPAATIRSCRPSRSKPFRQEMAAAGQNYELVIYPRRQARIHQPGRDRGRQEVQLPLEYNAEADAASWQKLRELLARIWPN